MQITACVATAPAGRLAVVAAVLRLLIRVVLLGVCVLL